jgi:hypothetical protein
MARRRTTQTTDDQNTDPAGTDAANAQAPAPPPARRGRRTRTDSDGGETTAAATNGNGGTAPAVVAANQEPAATTDIEPQQQPRQQRRRRRRNTIDTAAEASRLIAALLRYRGPAGASQDELRQVVAWGRGTRAESQELQRSNSGQKGTSSSGRTRRASEEAIARTQRSELNTLLLERVLLGTLGLDVQNGQLLFRRQEFDGQQNQKANG